MSGSLQNVGIANALGALGIGGSLSQPGLSQLAQLAQAQRQTQMSLFRVEKIANGFVVHLARYEGEMTEKHYAEDMKAVGDRIVASLTQWYLEGEK